MRPDFTARQTAECVERFGDELAALVAAFDRDCRRMSPFDERINAVVHQEHLEQIARAFHALGAEMCGECDRTEEADDRRRGNPLEPDFRRFGA